MSSYLNLKSYIMSILVMGVILLSCLSGSLPLDITKGLKTFNVSFIKMDMMYSFLSMSFFVFILIISLSVFIWNLFYMKSSSKSCFFSILMSLFVMSMLTLVLSNSFLMVFMGWEGLGVTSFILIIFYQNWKSVKGGMLTLLTNRLGDAFLMLTFSYWLSVFSFFKLSLGMSILVMFLLLLVSMTKSAQAPFVSWLPAAMAAPTPVSSLVHSSTLVTAGVWLLIRFSGSMALLWVFWLVLGSVTLLTASTAALGELDTKKIVALSTLSQLGLMFISLSLGAYYLCLFHLLMHALAKANLFIMIGNILHISFSQQDSRFISAGMGELFMILSVGLSIMSLSGLAFSSGFFSKELILILHSTKLSSLMSWLMMLLIISLTIGYCLKLLLSLSMSNQLMVHSSNFSKSSTFSSGSLMVLIFISGFTVTMNLSGLSLVISSTLNLYWCIIVVGIFYIFMKIPTTMMHQFFLQSILIDFFSKIIIMNTNFTKMKVLTLLEPSFLVNSFNFSKGNMSQVFHVSLFTANLLVMLSFS